MADCKEVKGCPYDPQRMGELIGAVHEVNTVMTRGFQSINSRLDTANGRTGKIEAEVQNINSWRDKINGGVKVLAWLVGLPSVVYALIRIFAAL